MQSGSGWPIVARDNELCQALAALHGGAEFDGVAFVGDSGVGKSTLARAVADTLGSGGATVRYVLGTQTGSTVPLGAFYRSVTVDAPREPAAMLAAAHKTLSGKGNWSSSSTMRSGSIRCRRRWCTNLPPPVVRD
jgi:hypothetical protein